MIKEAKRAGDRHRGNEQMSFHSMESAMVLCQRLFLCLYALLFQTWFLLHQ